MKEIQNEPWRAGQGVFSQQCVTLTHRAINIASNKFQIAVWLSLTIVAHTLTYAPKASPAQSPFQSRSQVPSLPSNVMLYEGVGGETTVAVPADTLTSWTSFACLRSERRYGDWRWGANDFQRTKAAPHPEPFCCCHVSWSENTG